MVDHEAFQLADDRARLSERESRFDEVFHSHQPQLFESHRLAARPFEIGELVERGPPPQRQRAAEQVDDFSRCRRRVRIAYEVGESRRVDTIGGSLQEVARCTTEDVDVGREGLPEPGHVALDGGDGRRGRSISPQRVGQPVDRHDRPPVREQHGQREPGLRSADRDRRPAPRQTSSGPSTLTNSSTTRASSPCLQAPASRLASGMPADSRELASEWVHAGLTNPNNEGEMSCRWCR